MSDAVCNDVVRGESILSWRRQREYFANAMLALLFVQFARANVHSLMEVFRLSTLLILLKVLTDVGFILFRRLPKDVSFKLYDWVIAIAGTYAVVLFRPADQGQDLMAGQILQAGGICLQIVAMFSLNRSLGIVPANRGIRVGGLYRLVRHPLYFSYVVAFLGYVICQPSLRNIGIYAASVVLWVLRLLAEERFLSQDEAYRSYAEKVRYRIVPGIF